MDYKRLPYGVADYTWIKSQNRYCADKTMFIPKMEEAGDFLYLIRPRRFGKSVFLTMLQAYYDIEKKDSFHTTFKDTWIESHPTEGLGKYQVLYFDFSRAAAGQGSLEENFNIYCNSVLDGFIKKYAAYYDEDFNMEEYLGFSGASYKLNALNTYSKSKGTQLYLIIDEYDNYCFAKDSLYTDPKMFNSDMVIYYLRHFIRFGKAPDEMVDPNTMTDYAKMKKIIFLDKLQGDRKSVLKEIINQGYIWAELRESFPAEDLVDPDLFPSLLYYYGMLTIIGKRGRRVKLGIPNENVRRQYYGYVLDEYNKDTKINNNHLADRYDVMALDGNIKPAIEYIAEGYKNCTSIHSSIQAERNLQGFIAAYLNHSGYYYIIQEMELNGGYCDLTMIPDLTRFPEVAHAYLLELKYLKSGDTDEEGMKALEEAKAQLDQYAQDARLPQLMSGKPIHKIAIIYKGNDLWRVEEWR